MKRILITGASGFLGRHLTERLLKEDVSITAMTAHEALLPQLAEGKLCAIGRNDFDRFDPNETDVIINCAFPRSSDHSLLAGGIDHTAALLSRAAQGNCAFINISSQSVYSQKRSTPADESTPPCLESEYAAVKYALEVLTNSVLKKNRHTNLRLASLIGPGFDQRLVNKMARTALNGDDIRVLGGTQVFGFMDVRSAADAVAAAALDDGGWDEVYNVGAGAYTLLEIAKTVAYCIRSKTGREPKLILEDGGEWQNSSLNSAKFRARFNAPLDISFEESVNDIIDNMLG